MDENTEIFFRRRRKKEYEDVEKMQEMKNSSSVSQYFGSTEHFDQQLSKEEEVSVLWSLYQQ